jgi:hypothetical protein
MGEQPAGSDLLARVPVATTMKCSRRAMTGDEIGSNETPAQDSVLSAFLPRRCERFEHALTSSQNPMRVAAGVRTT